MSGLELLGLIDDPGTKTVTGTKSSWVEVHDGAPYLHIEFESDDGQQNYGKWMLIKQDEGVRSRG